MAGASEIEVALMDLLTKFNEAQDYKYTATIESNAKGELFIKKCQVKSDLSTADVLMKTKELLDGTLKLMKESGHPVAGVPLK